MAIYIKIAAIGPKPLQLSYGTSPKKVVDNMLSFWEKEFGQVLVDKPDLIFL